MVTRVPEVLKVTPKTWKKDSGEEVTTYWVTLDDRTEDVPCFDAAAKDLKIREPLPEGWEVKRSKKDKDYLATPKPKGGKGFEAAYRNTQAGQAYEQERMDRRTALMQAVANHTASDTASVIVDGEWQAFFEEANLMYAWLRASAAGVIPSPAAVEKEEAGEPMGKGLPASSVNVEGAPDGMQVPPTESAASRDSKPAPESPSSSTTSSGEPVDGKPESEGVRGDDAPSDKLEGPSNLDKLYAKYGNGNKALLAARKYYSDNNPPSALVDLSDERMEELLERV